MAAFEENDFPMCQTCHSNHLIVKPYDQLIGTEEPAVCAECHSQDDGTLGFETATKISSAIATLVSAHQSASVALAEATELGMMTTDEEFRLKEVNQSLVETRTMIHSFDADEVTPKAAEGLEKAKLVEANSLKLVEAYYFRRKGLGVATIFITLVVLGLYLKIRKMD